MKMSYMFLLEYIFPIIKLDIDIYFFSHVSIQARHVCMYPITKRLYTEKLLTKSNRCNAVG